MSLAGQTRDDVSADMVVLRTSNRTEPNQMLLVIKKADKVPRKMDASVSVNEKITEICASRYRTSQRM